jgi:hypothetical protein
MSDTTEPAERPDDKFLALAIEKNLDIEKLGKLIDLRNAEVARKAKADFDAHFAEMQRDYVPVLKDRQANDDRGNKLYAYCPLETILKTYQPIISKHGFSYRWSEEAIAGGKRIWCISAGYGHEERSYVDIPIPPGNRAINETQRAGSAVSYGKRYSFINAFGVVIGGEDDDAQTVPRNAHPAASGPAATARTPHGPVVSSGPMEFSAFIALLNKIVPSKERVLWMRQANGGKDRELLGKLSAEIHATYSSGGPAPGSETIHEEPAPEAEEKPSEKDTERARITIMEYINAIVPEPDRPPLRMKLEKTPADLGALTSLYTELHEQYGDPGLFAE